MSPSRPVVLALALGILAVLACQPSVESSVAPASVDYAVFDVAASPPQIPQPSDITLAFADQVPGAQGELLRVFKAQGGFPYDQEVPITFGMVREAIDAATGAVSTTATSLDLASLKPCPAAGCNVLLLRVDGATPAPAPFEASYAAGTTTGTLTLRNPVNPATGSRAWPAGARYVAALRGGASGVKVVGGAPIQPQSTMYLLTRDEDLTLPENQAVLPGTPAEKAALGLQLELLRQSLLPAFAAVGAFGFPSAELADLTTFAVAPAPAGVSATTWAVGDPAAGVVPLPSDFLIDPGTNLVNGNVLEPVVGALAPFFSTLDGFSTTAMTLAQTSAPIQAGSVHSLGQPAGVYLFKLSTGGSWVQVPDVVDFLSGGGSPPVVYPEPYPITLDLANAPNPCAATLTYPATCVSTVIGLQPATPVPGPSGTLTLPPLDEGTEYAVVITNRVKDAAGNAIAATTLGQILLLTSPLYADGRSQLAGVSDSQAQGLEAMRVALQPLVAKLAAPPYGLSKSDIAFAYTFRTQTITQPALLLGAAPYQKDGSGNDLFPPSPYVNLADPTDPLNPKALAPDAVARKHGVPTAAVAGVGGFVEAHVVTFDKLDPATGAFYPVTAQGTPTPIPVLVALPAGPAPAGGFPLVIFHHGLGGSRADMLLIAGALAGNGLAAAAIDAAKHGDRSWCSSDAECAAGTCNKSVFGNQGDAPPGTPGLCSLGLKHAPLAPLPACGAGGAPPQTDCWDGTGGNALSSSSFLISGNLFRWRDSVRQDILDQSMLVRVLTTPQGQAVIGATLDPAKVYYVGQSLGSIEGTVDLAANPRFSRAVLNVGGGTWADIGITSPAFTSLLASLLASLGIAPGTPEFLQFVQVVKWVMDPAEPLNFAQHLVQSPLPNLLADPNGSVAQAPKVILGQAARCDGVVPNPTNQQLYGLIGLSPLDPATSASGANLLQWYMKSTSGVCPADGSPGNGASHGFLLDPTHSAGQTAAAQQDAVLFLLGLPVSATPVVIP